MAEQRFLSSTLVRALGVHQTGGFGLTGISQRGHCARSDLVARSSCKSPYGPADGSKIVEISWPVVLEQARKRAVGEDPAFGLTAGTIVGFVIGIADSLHGCAAYWAGLTEPAVNSHLGTKRGDFLGPAVTGLGSKTLDPFEEDGARRTIQSFHLVRG